jgi:ABC-type branched-subunit amino acid transport system substrate-binding protein
LIRDDQSNPEVADLAARQLINDAGAVILIGSVSPGTTAVLRDVASELGVILIATTDTPRGLDGVHFDPSTFLLAPTVYQDAMAICDFWNGDNSGSTYAQIAPDYPLGQRAAAAFRDACAFGGGEFAADDVMAPAGTTDFSALLEPASSSDVFLVTWAGGSLPRLLAAAAASGVDQHAVSQQRTARHVLCRCNRYDFVDLLPLHGV